MEIRSYETLLDDLSELCGVVPEYYDICGKKHIASRETRKAILAAMGLKVDSPADLEQEYQERLWRDWKDFIRPVTVISVNQPLTLDVSLPLPEGEEKDLTLSWVLTDEEGRRTEAALTGDRITLHDSATIDGVRYIRTRIADDVRRDLGYYTLTVHCLHPRPLFPDGQDRIVKTAKVIITPDACFVPPPLRTGQAWGLSVNLYAVRSAMNWGAGDLGDLKGIVTWIAGLGGGFVGINPLHAIPNSRPCGISPYSPISRLYRNFIYLDMNAVADAAGSEEAGEAIAPGAFRDKLDEIRKGDFVEYDKVALLKEELLRRAFDRFYEHHYKEESGRGREFRRYCAGEGEDLIAFGTYMALARRFGVPKPCGPETKEQETEVRHPLFNWKEWPDEYHNPSGDAVLSFRNSSGKEILFYQYVQWLIDRQLEEIADAVRKTGMSVGLYYDLAVGSSGGGSDAWQHQGVIGADMDLGAPPDDFNTKGQNWGFPTYNWPRMKQDGFGTQAPGRSGPHLAALRRPRCARPIASRWCAMPPIRKRSRRRSGRCSKGTHWRWTRCSGIEAAWRSSGSRCCWPAPFPSARRWCRSSTSSPRCHRYGGCSGRRCPRPDRPLRPRNDAHGAQLPPEHADKGVKRAGGQP